MVVHHHEQNQHRPAGLVRIQPSDWCLDRLRMLAPGVLTTLADDAPPRLRVLCVAEHDDLVLVVLDDASRTWSLVWAEVTVEVTGIAQDGEHWVVRAQGVCERDRVPLWAAERGARALHPVNGSRPAGNEGSVAGPPIGLRLREVGVRGYSVSPYERAAG